MLSWRSHATMVTLGLEKLSSSTISSALTGKPETTGKGQTCDNVFLLPQELLPRERGGHLQQDGLPLLPLMQLPDPSGAILTSTHKPATANAPSDQRQRSCTKHLLTRPGSSHRTFDLSGKTGCCPLCPAEQTCGQLLLHVRGPRSSRAAALCRRGGGVLTVCS